MSLRVLNWNFTKNMSNPSSNEFKNFATNFEQQMNIVYQNFTGYQGVEILELLNGSVRVRFRVIVVTSITKKGQRTVSSRVEITKKVVTRARTGFVENLQVDARPEAMETDSPPPAPEDVTISNKYEDGVALTWNKPEDYLYFGIKGYYVEFWLFGAKTKEKTDIFKGVSAQVKNLEADTSYTAHVLAVNSNGNGEESKPIEFRTEKRTLKDWQIALIVLCCVIFCIIIVALIVICCRRKKQTRRRTDSQIFAMKDAKKFKDSALYHDENDNADLKSYTNQQYVVRKWTSYQKENLVLSNKLGEGEFGAVYKGQLIENSTTRECAVKTLRDFNNEEAYRDLFKELELMSHVGYHPNLVNLIGAVCEEDILYVIVEYAANGALSEYLRNADKKPLDYNTRLGIALDVAKGMTYLEMKRCVHRDLAARNVLLDENLEAKVADFGLSRDIYESGVYEKTTTGKLPTRWMALESLEMRRFTFKTDVWSFGVLLWEIESDGRQPFGAINFKELVKFLKSGRRLEKPDQTPDELYRLMTTCWSADPGCRPAFAQICDTLSTMLGHKTKGSQNPAYDGFDAVELQAPVANEQDPEDPGPVVI